MQFAVHTDHRIAHKGPLKVHSVEMVIGLAQYRHPCAICNSRATLQARGRGSRFPQMRSSRILHTGPPPRDTSVERGGGIGISGRRERSSSVGAALELSCRDTMAELRRAICGRRPNRSSQRYRVLRREERVGVAYHNGWWVAHGSRLLGDEV